MSIKKLHLDRETLVHLTEEASNGIHAGGPSPTVICQSVQVICKPSVLVACITLNQTICHVSQVTACCPISLNHCTTIPTHTIPTTVPTTTVETSYQQ